MTATLTKRGGHSMSFQDKSLKCIDCGLSFIFSAVDQEYYLSRGYKDDAQRCMPCRQARQLKGKTQVMHSRAHNLHTITCVRCGRDASVPRDIHTVSPVYCNECCLEMGFQGTIITETGMPSNTGSFAPGNKQINTHQQAPGFMTNGE